MVKQSGFIKKGVSILLVYALFIDAFVPGAFAVGEIYSGKYISGIDNHSSAVFFQENMQNSLEDLPVSETGKGQFIVDSETRKYATEQIASLASLSAVSGGPGQTEAVGTSVNMNSDLVNLFTGDLNYGLPLIDLEGFPISLSYNANISMEEEASWVGLGWNLSLGSINRELRGLPDDFQGDKIDRRFKTRKEEVGGSRKGPVVTEGLGIAIGANWNENTNATFQVSSTKGILFGKYTNNYTGIGHTKDLIRAGSISIVGVGANIMTGHRIDDQNGIGVSTSVGFQAVPSFMGNSLGGVTGGKTWSSDSRSGIKIKSRYFGYQLGITDFGTGFSSTTVRGSSRTFGVPTFVPRYELNSSRLGTEKTNLTGVTGLYIPFFGNVSFKWIKYNNENSFLGEDHSINAYGYYHLSKAANNQNAMLDYSRGKGREVDGNSLHLNFSIPTYDMYYCNAPGITSQYRANRYEAYKLNDPRKENRNLIEESDFATVITGGGVISAPNVYIVGVDITKGKGSTTGQSYTSGANNTYFKYIDTLSTYNQKEYYLKTIGEMTPVNTALFDKYHQEKPRSLAIEDQSGNDISLSGEFNESDPVMGSSLPALNYELSRPQNIIHYREYSGNDVNNSYGTDLFPQNYTAASITQAEQNDFSFLNAFNDIEPVTSRKPGHLTACVEVVNESGIRYIFNQPAFNYKQKEVTFSSSGLKQASDYNRTGLIRYTAGDNTPANNRGRMAMYDAMTIPSYAHSFLLRTIYSSDYADLTGDGPSQDDQGNYYKINYTNFYGEDDSFKWRSPMTGESSSSGNPIEKQNRLAYMQENLLTDPWDDAAHYIYGEKDYWMVQSVHSKNFVAVFYLENRIDQFSAKNEDGGLDLSMPGKRLKKIMIYAKSGSGKGNPVDPEPIQVVEFEYDYSLCPQYVGNKNSHPFYGTNDGQGTGKLTLKKVYIYSGKSLEGKKTPYVFTYSATNPSYAFNSSDKWGNYKPNNPVYPNHKYPVAEQDNMVAAQHIQAWKLEKVLNPLGGEMTLSYEPDTYSHVQNERAMRMFSIAGMSTTRKLEDANEVSGQVAGNNIHHYASNTFREGARNEKKKTFTVVYFKLEEPLTTGTRTEAGQVVKKQYFMNEAGEVPNGLIFKMGTFLGGEKSPADIPYEEVISKARISTKKNSEFENIGVVGSEAPFLFGYVVLELDTITSENNTYHVTDLQKSNWEFARKNTPYIVYGNPDYSAVSATSFVDYETGLDAKVIFGGSLNKRLNKKRFGIRFKPEYSFIRLFEPDSRKIGGGARISSVTFSDNWNSISGGEKTASYRWVYSYEKEEGRKMQTYGVAAYEPVVAAEENPLYDLIGYSVNMNKLPTETRAHIAPLTELAYPAPVVGYRQVTTSFSGTEAISTAKSIGKTTVGFYTAKEYPVISRSTVNEGAAIKKIDMTGKQSIRKKGVVSEKVGFSEGYVVITNDFHGKMKENTVYNAAGDIISKVKYNYINTGDKVKYLNENGGVTESSTPRELDIYVESWKNYSVSTSSNKAWTFSTGATIVTGPPFAIPYFYPSISKSTFKEEKVAVGLTLNKLINYSAVISSVETTYLGSYNVARNLLWDSRNGSVILSSLKDEFNDDLYSFSYPAYWRYKEFSSKNISEGAFIKYYTASGNQITLTAGNNFSLSPGDQLEIISSGNIRKRAWILSVNGNTGTLISETGTPLSGVSWSGATVKVLYAGVKNILAADMMSVSTKTNPLSPSNIFTFPTQKIINTSVVVYQENNNLPCRKGDQGINRITDYYTGNFNPYQLNQVINPFRIGLRGNLKHVASYNYQVSRNNFTDPNGIRENGTFESYVPFYQLSGGKWKTIKEISGNYGNWRSSGNVSAFSEDGKTIQSTSPLLVHSAAMVGYSKDIKAVQSAVASNAKVQDIGFEGFEIYKNVLGESYLIPPPHFSLYEMVDNGGFISDEDRHSGKYSLKITGKAEAYFPVRGADPALEENIEGGQYKVRACDCIYGFEPKTGETYLASVWAKPSNEQGVVFPKFRMVFYNSQNVAITPELDVFPKVCVDGWYKLEHTVTVPAGAAKLKVQFGGDVTSEVSYFDDFRVHPYQSVMNTAVYDQKTLLPMAEQDDANFSVFYGYDENYQPVRTRVETTEGIQTVSEQSNGIRKTN